MFACFFFTDHGETEKHHATCILLARKLGFGIAFLQIENPKVSMSNPVVTESLSERSLTRQVTADGVLGDDTDWALDMKELKTRLSRLPMVAVLLPSEKDSEALSKFKGLSSKGVSVEVAAHTSYLHCPRTIWILSMDADEGNHSTPAKHLTAFVNLISEETQVMRPVYGPWLWPLNDSDVCAAISLSEIADPQAKWWRKGLWALRMIPPENGSILEKCIMDHYGRETGYVFAWANLFTRGLWVISLPMLIFGIANVKPGEIGVNSLAWYILQLLTLIWALGMATMASSRQAVLRSGAGLKRHVVASDAGHVQPPVAAVPESDVPLPGAIDETKEDKDITGIAPDAAPAPQSEPEIPNPSGKKGHLARKEQVKQTQKTKVDPKKVATALASDKVDGAANDVVDYHINPEYKAGDPPIRRYIYATIVTAGILTLFLSLATFVLSLVLQLKSYLIYEWGECIRLSCDNAGQKHGFPAVLVDISVDILLALVFIVGLGESCKGMSFQLARIWNFRLMRTRQAFQSLVSLCIEVMAKVGVFVILAFIFLPSWSSESINGSSELPEVVCAGQVDYDVCRAMGCDGTDPYCCSGTLSCARQLLPFSARRALFENWLAGPFVVAPFVDLIPAVLAPILADKLADMADEGASSRCGRCCCLSCGWLARFLAFIFVLDGGVTGLRYVCLGKTFRDTTSFDFQKKEVEGGDEKEDDLEDVEGALEQVTLREFDAIEEIKELKLNFMFVLLFAPLKPLLVLPTLLARLIEVRAKLQKVFLIRRRNVPRDARLVHGPQELFTVFALVAACFWHVGLVFMAYNDQLPSWDFGTLLGLWLGISVVIATLAYLIYRQADKRSWALLVV